LGWQWGLWNKLPIIYNQEITQLKREPRTQKEMALHLNGTTSLEMNPGRVRSPLPWWTWIAPFFIANLGTWLSLLFKADPGTSLWYLPTAFGIVMAYWWGPRVLLGIYLNAVVCTPLWDLPWQWSFLYALPETIEVGLSWLLFVKLFDGKYWLPDLKNVWSFMALGSIIPTFVANTYLVLQLYFLGDITKDTILDNWRILFSADMATQFVLAVPMLIIFSSRINKRGWTQTPETIPQIPFLAKDKKSWRDILLIIGILFTALMLIVFPITRNYWALYGLLMILLAIRYGVNMAVVGTSWIGILAYLLPIVLTGELGLPTGSYHDILTINFNILFLSGVTLITGRVITDLFTEITERKQSEEKLQESELRLRAIIDTSPDSITLTDLQGNIQMANRQSAVMYGYANPDDLIGTHVLSLIAPEDQPRMTELASLPSELNNINEFKLLRQDGTTFPGELRASVMTNENGVPQSVVGVMRDITDRKQVDEYLRTAEAKYRTLAEQIPPIVYISGPDQHIGVTYISPRIESLGFAVKDWIADPELWVRQLHPDDHARIMDEIERNKQSGKPFSSEYRLITRDGKVKWFVDEAIDIVSDDGKLLYRQGFMLDITERKQVEESLFAHEQYLELLNEMTSTILRSTDFDSTLHTLAVDMAKLLNADDCYITRWDEERQWIVRDVATAKLKTPYTSSDYIITPTETDMTISVLKAGHVLAADDVFNSPYISVEVAKRYPARSALGVPLIVGEHKLGAAIIAYNTPHHFTSDEIESAGQAGNQVALALWSFQQSMEIQQRLKESEALAKIERVLSESERTGIGEVLQLIVDSVRELMPHAERSVIHLLDSDEQVLIAQAVSGSSDQGDSMQSIQMKPGEGIAGQVIHQGITINIGDIENDPRFIRTASLPNFRSLLVAPVQSGHKQIGTISVQSNQKFAFTAQDVELLKALGIQAAIAIENTRLFETTQQQLKEVDALYKINQGLVASLDANQLIKDVVILLHENFGYYHVQIYIVDPLNGDLILKSGSGSVGDQLLARSFRIARGVGIVCHVAETGESFVTNNVNAVVFFDRNPLLPDTQSELTVPIKVDGQVVGVLDIQNTPPNRFTNDDLQLMMTVADQLAVALQKANLYKELQTALQQETNIRSQLIQNERLALVGRLLASVSHELNNPLQAIQNALFLLKDETKLSEQASQDLNIILSETERMAALIEQLRSTYRPVRKQDFLPVQLNNLIEDVHMLIATHMRHKEIVFEFVPDSDLPIILGLSDQLRQVVLNLFLNAIEVMKPGGRITVLTCNLPQQNEVLLTVKDTGPGIDEEILPRIFEPFITSKYTGTGLGLTITHDIIQQHHGRIQAENDPQGGALFSIWLPMDQKGRE
jgi:PAS domain S-box-containing protein